MSQNIGGTDRIVRFVVAIVGLFLWMMQVVTGVAALVIGALSLVLLLSSITGVSLLYALFGISTREK